jgi:hypothetical protein
VKTPKRDAHHIELIWSVARLTNQASACSGEHPSVRLFAALTMRNPFLVGTYSDMQKLEYRRDRIQ